MCGVLDQILAFLDSEGIVVGAEIDGARVAADLAADGTGAELIWDRCLGVDGELNLATLAGSFQCAVESQKLDLKDRM